MSETGGRKRVSTYTELYAKVFDKRLKFVNHISVLLAVSSSFILCLPFGSLWWNLVLLVFKVPVVFVTLYLLKEVKSRTYSVNYSRHKTLAAHLYHAIISGGFWLSLVGYAIFSLVLAVIFLIQINLFLNYYHVSKEYGAKPKVNDEWTYLWFYALLASFGYNIQHFVFNRHCLPVKYGVSKVEPRDALFTKLPELLGHTIVINSALVVGLPILYLFVRSFVYSIGFVGLWIFGLDTKTPRFGLSFGNWISFGYFSFNLILVWELFNHVFNVYATIGCLDGKKPISTYSSDPINTLLSGLRISDPANELSKLTAFQELAYISTLNTPEGRKLRTAIYSAHSKNGFIFSAIWDECTILIKQTTQRINYRSSSDVKAVKTEVVKSEFNSHTEIFGNSFIQSPNKSLSNGVKLYDEISKPAPQKTTFVDQILAKLNGYLEKALANKNTPAVLTQVKPYIVKAQALIETYRSNFLATSIGIPFRITLKRDTESRVLNAVNYGNAVIALSNLLIHSIEEDKNLSITNQHVSDTLNMLERPIRACTLYVDSLPHSVFLTLEQRKADVLHSQHLINLLHSLTLFNFKQLCIAFNFKLGDLLLSAPCFKLAKRVVDEEIANRQKTN